MMEKKAAPSAKRSSCQTCLTRARCLMSAVPAVHLHLLADEITEKPVAKGTTILSKGESPGVLRILKVGQVMTSLSTEGDDTALMIVQRGAPIGLFGLFGLASVMDATAAAPSRLCEISLGALRRHTAWRSSIQQRAGELAHQHFVALTKWSAAARQSGTAARLAASLVLMQEDAGAVSFRMPSNLQWARLLGASRETVSRAVSHLGAMGCFERNGLMVGVNIPACRQVLREQGRLKRADVNAD